MSVTVWVAGPVSSQIMAQPGGATPNRTRSRERTWFVVKLTWRTLSIGRRRLLTVMTRGPRRGVDKEPNPTIVHSVRKCVDNHDIDRRQNQGWGPVLSVSFALHGMSCSCIRPGQTRSPRLLVEAGVPLVIHIGVWITLWTYVQDVVDNIVDAAVEEAFLHVNRARTTQLDSSPLASATVGRRREWAREKPSDRVIGSRTELTVDEVLGEGAGAPMGLHPGP